MKNKKERRSTSNLLLSTPRSKLLVLMLALILVIFSAFLIQQSYQKSSNGTDDIPNNVQSDQEVNLSPPNQSDLENNDNIKSKLNENSQDQSSKAAKVKQVKPEITSYGQTSNNLEVAARVAGINESGGKCILTMQRGSKTVHGERKGISNVSEVSCGYIKIAINKLSKDRWSAKVSYHSSKAIGESDSIEIEVK